MVQGALSCSAGSLLIQQELIAYRNSYEDALAQRFELANTQGDLPAHVNTAVLAKYLTTIHQGMSMQATSGATKDELLAITEIVLSNWPAITRTLVTGH